MKSWIAPIFLSLLCLPSPQVEGGQALEFLANPGFERVSDPDKLPDGWGRDPKWKGVCTVIADATTSHRGSYYLKLEYDPKMGEPPCRVDATCRPEVGRNGKAKVEIGKEYSISLWAKGKGRISVGVFEYDAGVNKWLSPTISLGGKEVNGDDWRPYEFIYTPTRAGALPNREEVSYADFGVWAEGVIYVDDFSFKENLGPDPSSRDTGLPGDMLLPRVTIPYLKPNIDGKLNQEEWGNSSTLLGLWAMKGEVAPLQTKFCLGFDEANLYVGFESPFAGGWPKASVKERDGDIWLDDSVEVFLKPERDKETTYQFVFNSKDVFFDARYEGRNAAPDRAKLFNANVKYKSSIHWLDEMMTSGIWRGEIAIPFSDLGVGAPSEGTVWQANFCRNNFTGKKEDLEDSQYTMWSYTQGGYNVPERFGELLFSRTAPVVNLERLLELGEGKVGFLGSIRNPSDKPRSVSLKYRVAGRAKDKIVFDEATRVDLPAKSSMPLKLECVLMTPGSGWPVGLQYRIVDESNQNCYQNLHYFTCFPAFRIQLIPLFGRNKLCLKVDARRLAGLPGQFTSRVEVAERDLKKVISQPVEGLSSRSKLTETSLDISTLEAGAYQVRVVLSDSIKDLAASTGMLTIPKKPAWLTDKVGVANKVPPPWVPLRVKHRRISCLTQEYDFGSNTPFPSSIRGLGEEILRSPVKVRAVVNGREVRWKKPAVSLLSATDRLVKLRMESVGPGLTLSGLVDVEYDGFVKVEWTLRSDARATIEYLGLDIPVKREKALYLRVRPTAGLPFDEKHEDILYQYLDCRCVGAKGWKWEEGHGHEVWLGDDDKGLAWVTDSFQNWHLKGNPIVVTNEGDFVSLRFNVIDKPTAVTEPLNYMMILMATPARARTPGWSKWHLLWNRPDVGHEIGANVITDGGHIAANNSPETYPQPKLGTKSGDWALAQINQAHKYGEKYFLTTRTYCPGYETPAFRTYGAEWKAIPDQSFPMQGTILGNACAKTAFTDFLLWDLRRTLREFKNDGFYCDSSGPINCANHYHGCGWWNDEKKEWEQTYNILGARELYKRFYQMLLEEGKTPPFLFHHGLASYVLAHFTDTTTFGEFMEAWKLKEELHYPMFKNRYERFRVWFAENQFGVVPRWYFSQLVKGKYIKPEDYPKVSEEALGICLLHNVEGEDLGYELYRKLWRIKDEFGIEGSEWFLYTRSHPYVSTERADIVVSFYRKKGKLLLIVGNSSDRSYQGKVTLNLARLQLQGNSRVTDKWKGETLPFNGGQVEVSIPAYGFKLLEVER